MNYRNRKIFLFTLLFFLTGLLKGQELLIQNEAEIKGLGINADGRLHLLFDNKICEFEGKQIAGECFELENEIDIIVPITDEYYVLIYDSILQVIKHNEIIKRDTISEIITTARLHNDVIIVGTAGKGLFSCPLNSGKIISLGLNDEFINDLLIEGNEVYAALDNGVAKLDTNKNEFQFQLLPSIITHLAATHQGIIAIGSENKVFKLGYDLSVKKINSIQTSDILQVGQSLNSIFLLTQNGCDVIDSTLKRTRVLKGKYQRFLVLGNNLLLSKENKLYSFDLTANQLILGHEVLSLYAENDSSLWVGSINKIELYINEQWSRSIVIPSELKNVSISSLLAYDSFLVVGTMGDGIFFLEKSGRLIKHFINRSRENRNNIIQLKHKGGKIWAAHLNGLFTIDIHSFELSEFEESSLEENYIYCLGVTDSNHFYLGTSSKGLLYFKNGQCKTYLEDFSVYSIHQSKAGLIIGTRENGIYLLKNDSIRLLIDKVSPRGITSLENLLLICQANHTDLFWSETTIPISNGNLKDLQLNCIAENNHSIYIGYANGIQAIDKKRLLGLKNIGLHLNQPHLFNQLIPQNESEFKYNENSFSFSFHSNSYYQVSSTIYKYRLLGLDSTWQTTQQNNMSFYNLRPGAYTFEVASAFSNNSNFNNTQRFHFTISKPYWQTTWFTVAVSLILVIVLLYAVRRREKILITKGQQEQEKIKFELEQLKNQIDPHFLFNSFNSLIGMIEENPQSAIESTQLLSDLYRNILKYEKLDLISISQELDLAKRYFHMHKIRFEDLIELKLEVSDQAKGQLIPLSCQFLIENAIKHNVINRENHMLISIEVVEDYLVISNSYHPKKINSDYSSGLGLKNLKARYKLLTERPVLIDFTKNYFTVKLPIIHD